MSRLWLALIVCAACKPSSEAREEEAQRQQRARAGDADLLYAMGALLGARVRDRGLSPVEREKVKAGFSDSAAGARLDLPSQDLEEWGPRVDAMMARRGNPAVGAEKERGAAFARAAASEQGATVLPSGTIVRVLKQGEGPNPAGSDEVKVSYQGKLIDGTVFDSSDRHGGPAQFALDKVIRCWTEGVGRLRAGAKAQLTCPSGTAYGDAGRPPQIPGGATLVFEVELLSVKH